LAISFSNSFITTDAALSFRQGEVTLNLPRRRKKDKGMFLENLFA